MPTQNPHRTVGLCTSNKVYSALTELKSLEGHRAAKFVALLAQNLVEKGVLSDEEVITDLHLPICIRSPVHQCPLSRALISAVSREPVE